MSHIPNSAMPHAGPTDESNGGGNQEGAGASISKAASKIADKARQNPKTAVAAGAAVVGAIAAAAIPLVRGRKKGGEETGGGKKSGGGKSSGTRKSSSKSE